jgi:selenocysteine-specific elongation factor
LIIGTAGHIDHGKTSLVKALTGVDTDRLKEEKERGITVDLGFAYMPLPDGEVLGFVDVPGHEKLVRNMLAGATGIDHVMLVVAADDGPMPQTREHLAIVDLLGLTQGVVALTKCDLVTPERLAEAQAEVRALLAHSALANAPILPLSSVTGVGIDTLLAHLQQARSTLAPRRQQG